MANPPPYDEATKGTHLVPSPGGAEREAPPTYEQLFGVSELREARKESSNHATFAVKFCQIITGTVACAVCMVLLSALPISMIVIGSVYLNDCPGSSNIPVWLVVFGCFSLIQTIVDIMKRCFKKKNSNEEEGSNRERYAGRSGSCLESFISFFLFIWIIIGSAWVFGFYDEFQDCRGDGGAADDECCDAVPYLFSFVVLVVIYSVSFLLCCCCCFAFVCAAFIGGTD